MRMTFRLLIRQARSEAAHDLYTAVLLAVFQVARGEGGAGVRTVARARADSRLVGPMRSLNDGRPAAKLDATNATRSRCKRQVAREGRMGFGAIKVRVIVGPTAVLLACAVVLGACGEKAQPAADGSNGTPTP